MRAIKSLHWAVVLIVAIWASPLQAQGPSPADTLGVARAALDYLFAQRAALHSGEPVYLPQRSGFVHFRKWPDGRVAPDSGAPATWSTRVHQQIASGFPLLTTPLPHESDATAAVGRYTVSLSLPEISGDEAIISVTTAHLAAGARRAAVVSEGFVLHKVAGKWTVVSTNVYGVS